MEKYEMLNVTWFHTTIINSFSHIVFVESKFSYKVVLFMQGMKQTNQTSNLLITNLVISPLHNIYSIAIGWMADSRQIFFIFGFYFRSATQVILMIHFNEKKIQRKGI